MFADDSYHEDDILINSEWLWLYSPSIWYINNLLEWSRILMHMTTEFNVSKCYLLHLKNSHCYSQDNIAGNIISSTDVIKDLGIYMDKEQIKVSL